MEGSQVIYWVPWKQMLGPWFLLLQLPGYRAMSSSVPPYAIAKMFCLDLGPEYRGQVNMNLMPMTPRVRVNLSSPEVE